VRDARSKSPRLGRPPGRFTQHRKLARLREALEAAPEGLALTDLAAALRVTTRSVRRYLRELAVVTDLDSIETAPGGVHLWRIKPSERGRTLPIRRTQAYGLLAARRIFDAMRGSALYDELDVVTRQLLQLARRPTRSGVAEIASDKRLEDRFVYVPEVARSYGHKGAELDDLFRAVADLRVLTFRYRARSTDSRGERVTLHPYAMILHRGAVHCVGLDVGRGEVRDFLLDKLSDTEASEAERFSLPDDFTVDDFVHGSFGIGGVTAKTRVMVEFDPSVSDEVRAERVHPSQKLAAAPDGRVRLSMTVGRLESVTRWVLGFGKAARVIEPAELREAVARELRLALDRYGR
jgi:predicted DNA-binding transcriptional regulator YafY